MQTIFVKHRVIWAILLLTSALVITLVLFLSQGSVTLNISEFYQALTRQGNLIKQTIIWDLPLPRIVVALIVGAALGMSSALLEGMLCNSLADLFILGISAGAGLIVIIMIVLQVILIAIPFAVWFGAILTSAIVIFLGRADGEISVERLILGGVSVSALFGSVQSTLLLMPEYGRV
jgi:iron complex transport system permease protein